jgi:hypothetical protein
MEYQMNNKIGNSSNPVNGSNGGANGGVNNDFNENVVTYEELDATNNSDDTDSLDDNFNVSLKNIYNLQFNFKI